MRVGSTLTHTGSSCVDAIVALQLTVLRNVSDACCATTSREIDRPAVEHDLAHHDARRVEQIVRQLREMPHLAVE